RVDAHGLAASVAGAVPRAPAVERGLDVHVPFALQVVPEGDVGLPRRSSARSAKSADASCPNPPSNTSWSVQVRPSSSDHATHTVWKVSSWVRLQPVAALVGRSAASQAA